MTVGVGVIAGGDVVLVTVGDEAGHGVGGGAVHADLAVGVQRHEAPRGVDRGVDDLEIQAPFLTDAAPVLHCRATHGVGADADLGVTDGVHVHHEAELTDVVAEVVMDGDFAEGFGERGPLDL